MYGCFYRWLRSIVYCCIYVTVTVVVRTLSRCSSAQSLSGTTSTSSCCLVEVYGWSN
uniref:Uncharacterized protein n=1 Tax=Anguilla anguilla TaxID=7936 RepID=A0A0E9X6C6_ANGAN